jgi:sugar phosphate isomerase/epimerase
VAPLRAPEVISAAVEAGLHAIEWSVGRGQALELESGVALARELRRRCEAVGVTICGLSANDAVLASGAPFARLLELAGELGAPQLRIMAPQTRRDALSVEMERLAEALRRAAELARAERVVLVVEPVPGSALSCTSLTRRLVAEHRAEDVGVVYDPGSMIVEGHLAPPLVTSILGGYLRHVHVKNMGWRRRRDGHWHAVRARLDQGQVDWPIVFSALRHAGYPGWLAIDHLPGPSTALALRREAQRARNLAGAP